MSTIPLQKAIETAKQNPDSEFAKKLRTMIEAGQLDEASVKQNYDLSPFGRKKPEEIKSLSMNRFQESAEDLKQGKDEFVQNTEKRDEKIQENFDAQAKGERGAFGTGVRNFGQLMGAGADAIGTTFKTAMKLLLSQKSENKVSDKAEEVITGIANTPLTKNDERTIADFIQKYEGLKETNPKLYRDLDAGLGVAELLSQFVGAKGGSSVVKATKQEGLKTVEEIATKAKDFTRPITSTAKEVVDATKKGPKAIKDLYQDVKPKTVDIRDRSIAKALRLTPTEDLAVIKQSTGNDVGEFMGRYDLIKDTPVETMDALTKFQRENYDLVRDAIALVDDRYTFADIPEMETTIDFLLKDLAGRKSPEYQEIYSKLLQLKKSKDFELLDAQYVKNVFDDVESVYKRTGDVQDAVNAQDKAQAVAPVRRFIEDRVSENYPDIDVQALNNNTQTTRSIIDAVVKRAPKADTASILKLGDFAVLGIGNAHAPGLGYGALFAKKIFEASPVQLRIARLMARKAENQAIKAGDVIEGLTPAQIKEMRIAIQEELRKAMIQGDKTGGDLLREIRNELNDVPQLEAPKPGAPRNSRSDGAVINLNEKSPSTIEAEEMARIQNQKEIQRTTNMNKTMKTTSMEDTIEYKGKKLNPEEFRAKVEESFWRYIENTKLDEEAVIKKLAKQFKVAEEKISELIDLFD